MRLKTRLKSIKNLSKVILIMLVKILLTRQDHCTIVKKIKKKGIYGTATKNEIQELKEEGVEAEMIPWIEDKSN